MIKDQTLNTRQWSPFVDDLWTAKDKLLHLGENTIGVVHKPKQEKYGLEGDICDDESDFEDESDRVVPPGPKQSVSTAFKKKVLPPQPDTGIL